MWFITHIVSDIESIAGKSYLLKSGKVIGFDTAKPLHSVEDKVWIAAVGQELNHLKEHYAIGNILQKADGFEIRIVSETKPCNQATITSPSLEDVFVYYFGGQEI